MNIEKIREIFESFDGPSTFKKDKHENYNSTDVHNIFVGFKNWYIEKFEVKEHKQEEDKRPCLVCGKGGTGIYKARK